MHLFAFEFAFDEFWLSKFPFDECKFKPASSHHYSRLPTLALKTWTPTSRPKIGLRFRL